MFLLSIFKQLLNFDFEKAQYLDAINERLVKKETRRQNNIENVVAVAGKVLQAEETVSEDPLNPDWATRFFDIAQDVSDEEIQTLWGVSLLVKSNSQNHIRCGRWRFFEI